MGGGGGGGGAYTLYALNILYLHISNTGTWREQWKMPQAFELAYSYFGWWSSKVFFIQIKGEG